MTQKIVRGTVVQAYPSREGASGKPTPHNIVLEDGTKVSFWANKVQIDDVYSMIGNRYIFITSGSSEYNGVTTYTGEGFESMTTPITSGTQSVQDGNGGEVEGSSSPVPETKQLSREDSIIRQVAFKEAMNLTIASGITVENLLLDDFNFLVNNLFEIAKGSYLPPEPIDVIDLEDEEQKELFPNEDSDTPF